MALILSIETSTPNCSVALALDGRILAVKEINSRNSHAEVLTAFIQDVLEQSGKQMNELDAVAVSMGPGSYTGLRIGVSTAKGLCFALDKPLIAVSTLQAMAFGMSLEYCARPGADCDALFCPMIDARRMEVYAAIYKSGNEEVREVKAEIIDDQAYQDFLSHSKLVFGGDGSEKCKEMITSDQAIFLEGFLPSSSFMVPIAEHKFNTSNFEDLAYFEPYYLKDFVGGIPKVKGLR
ncbi:MAG: tRNA (adenosine(37)-N6)-threonylcarbamoyltransferase complex dimerization subunit type 1 TsaB [Bacteroidales bacterium]|nr:tRNA (adenosine(37)-N6)-threonylcarbamoyltransferase complex dimerization subunit type 1 TsaB [Bacteroidales bacterium]